MTKGPLALVPVWFSHGVKHLMLPGSRAKLKMGHHRFKKEAFVAMAPLVSKQPDRLVLRNCSLFLLSQLFLLGSNVPRPGSLFQQQQVIARLSLRLSPRLLLDENNLIKKGKERGTWDKNASTWKKRKKEGRHQKKRRTKKGPMAPFAPPLFRAFCASSFFFLSACRGAPSAGWLRSRQDSFCCGPSLGLLLLFSTLFLCFLLRPFCGFCGLHGGALTVCCFFFLCVSSASAVWASRLWWTGFSTSQACTWGSQLSALASVGASRCASPLPLSGFVAGGLRPAPAAPLALRRFRATAGLESKALAAPGSTALAKRKVMSKQDVLSYSDASSL